MTDDPASTLDEDELAALERGIVHWNAERFREAADEFEDAWFSARGAARVALHGLYEVAVGWTLLDEGKARGHREVGGFGIAELGAGVAVFAGRDLHRFAAELATAMDEGSAPPRILRPLR